MKKKLFFLLTLLVCCVGQVWGETAELNSVSTKKIVEKKGESVSLAFGDVTCTVTRKSSNQPGFYTTKGIVRYYGDDVMTLSVPEGGTITNIAFTYTSGGTNHSAGVGTFSSDGKEWTGSANSVSFTGKGTVKINTITVTYTISVPTDELKSLTVSGTPTKTTYEAGEEFDPAGLTVTGTYSESGNKTVTHGITWTYDPEILTVGTTSVSVVAKVGDIESSEYIVNGLTVNAPKTLTSIAISGTPTKMEYQVGDAFNPAGLVVTGTYSDSSQEEITDGIEWIITPSTFAEVDVAASVSVVAKVGTIESPAYNVSAVIVKEKTTPSALVVDFENALNTYTDWVFTNAEQGTTTITAHGGTYYGTTGGKGSASIQTKDIIAAPQSFTCYISKQSNNTSACTWNIQVSSDGDNWTAVATTDAKAMNKGVWVEFSADLSSYANVYVRIYYSGSTAVRNIDDITLTMGKASTDPFITASNVKIDADATSGEIAYTIKNPVAGKTLTATTDADWITITQVTDEKVTFTTTANTEATERSADITLKYEGATDKVVTVTQKAAAVVLTTIDQIFAKATEAGKTATEVSIKFDGWYVTGVKDRNAYATDGTKGFIIYGNDHGFVVGDALTGTVTCKVQLFNGSAELTQLTTSTEGLTVTPNHSISAVEKTIDQLSGINTGAVVTIKNVTYDGANFTDGTNAFLPYNTLMTLPTFEKNGKYNITGVYLQYGGKKEILPRSEADIESLATTKYTITWSVNGTTTTEEVNEGAAIDFKPATVPAGYTADYVFRGWTTESTVDAEPTYVTEATATENVTYYAVFAKKTTTGGSGNYELVTENQSDWSGDYLIAYNDHIFADGRVGGTTGMGAEKVAVDPESNLDGTTVSASWGDLYNVTLEEVSKGSGTYLMLTKDGKYNYQSSNSNGLVATENRDTAEDHPITINFVDNYDVQMIVHNDCIFHYNTDGYFRFYKNGGQEAVYLYKKQAGTVTYSDFTTTLVAPEAYTLEVSQHGYSTLYLDKAVEIPEGVTVYYCTYKNAESLSAVKIDGGYIPANTGVVVEAKAGTYAFNYTDQQVDEFSGSVLGGVLVDTPVQEIRERDHNAPVYVLSIVNGKVGFYNYADTATLKANRAFFEGAEEQPPVKGFILDFNGTEGINTVVRATNLKAGYDLQGRRINQMQKGINILNGKTIIK